MSHAVIKLIVLVDEDTAGMITDFGLLPLKQRDNEMDMVKFTFTDKNSIEHELNFIHAEEV